MTHRNERISRTNPPMIPPASVFGRMNDSERMITKKIMKRLEEADRNKDGCFNKEELKHALKDLGAFFPAWRTNRAFRKADANNDGQISGDEIYTLHDYLRSCGFGK